MTTTTARTDLQTILRQENVRDTTIATLEPFGAGNSGYTYLATTADGESFVLRLSPPNVRIAGPADVGRQGRIMAALGAAGAPVPPVIACSSEPVIDGRAFVLMHLVEGDGWDSDEGPKNDEAVAAKAIAALHRLQRIPVTETGIGDESPFGPKDEINRWASLAGRCVEEVREDVSSLAESLVATAPPPSAPVLVHGDYHYANLIFRQEEVVAVVDWEIAALGEPLLDLGCLAVASMRRRYSDEPNPTGNVQVSVAELLALYGTTEDAAAWFVSLSCLKYGAILGYNLGLHRGGKRHDPMYEQLQGTMHGLLAEGRAVAQDGLAAVRN